MSRLAHRRNLLKGGLAAAVGTAAAWCAPWLAWAADRAPRVIEVTARRFRYEPSEITLKVGEPVVVEIRSLDFVHGMNIPDLGKRLDLVPGQIARLEFTPTRPGDIDFVCDNFCGDGHEEMHGRFVVTA